jgi:hypothetical protein
MPEYFENTVSALVYELCALHGATPRETYPCYNDVVRFVLEQLDRMPSFLALPTRAATMAFGASRLLLEGSFFHQRESQRRRLQVETWRRSKLGPCQDLMKFYASLVVLALYSRPQAACGGAGRNG